jgi:hypothetical protein
VVIPPVGARPGICQRRGGRDRGGGDCGKYETELSGEVAKGKLTLRNWMRKNRAWTGCAAGTARSGPATSSAPPAPPVAEQRLKECTEALESFAEQVYQARERP